MFFILWQFASLYNFVKHNLLDKTFICFVSEIHLMRFNFIPIDFDYFDFEGKNYVQLVGRNKEGEKICIIDSYESNFWVILKENADAEEIAAKIVKAKVIKPSRTTVVLKTEIHDKKLSVCYKSQN